MKQTIVLVSAIALVGIAIAVAAMMLYPRVLTYDVTVGNQTFPSFPLTRTVSGPAVRPDFTAKNAPFTLCYQLGSGWHGYNTLEVSDSGECQYVFGTWDAKARSFTWRRATFKVTPSVVAALRQEVEATGYFRLYEQYHTKVADGTQIGFRVRLGTVEKRVYCNNHFPSAIVKLANHCEHNVIGPHRQTFSQAVVISESEARAVGK